MSKAPIHILGSGPAGLSAAIVLAKAGREVHVHERYDAAGKRFSGDLQGLENWTQKQDVLEQLRSYGLDTDFEATPFRKVTFTSGTYSFDKTSQEPLFYLVKRGPMANSLDSALSQQAEKLDVRMHYRSQYPQEKADIIATGPLRNALVANDKGVVFPTNLPNMAVGIFHDDFAYQGYAYLLVSEGYGCLCTVVFKDLHRLNSCFEKTLELARRLYPINFDGATPVGGIGSFCLNHPRMQHSIPLVGEAAGLQDMLWGFGIRTAITSGYMAAKSLLENQNYGQRFNEKFYPYLKTGIVNRFLWEKIKWNSRTLIPYLLQLPMPIRTQFRMLYDSTPVHRMLYPMALRYIKKHYPNSIDCVNIEKYSTQQEL